ncbi:hypothetical protein [Thiothrix lacustris]|uniref:hypothetical protein n=1 Tax=Thiothrix lacustris TaxID=525917 RepID=UPI000A82FCE3|nr:hypothetical protein [Thiothrix lacustris]
MMSEALLAQQMQGTISPIRQCPTFHRLNLEYVAFLRGLQPPNIAKLLDNGIRGNLHQSSKSGEEMSSLHAEMEWQATTIFNQSLQLLQDKEHFRKRLLANSNGSFVLYRAGMSADLASKKLSESLVVSDTGVSQRILLAEQLLIDALSVNEHNYRAHFELGWIYLFLLDKLPESTFHLTFAMQQADVCNPQFAQFVRRHLADAWYGLQKFGESAELMMSVLPHALPGDLEVRYELSRYLAASGETQAAAQQLAQVVGRSPLYYVQAQVEPDFAGNSELVGVLQDLRSVRVQRIQHYVHAQWQQNALASLALPDQIDSGALFQQVVEQHERVMTHLPYVTLSQREQQIGARILAASQQRIIREVRLRSRHYEQVAEKERQRWSWINQTGGLLVHLSTILLLASLMFYLLRFVLDLFGIGNLLDADAMVSNILGSMLLLGSAGTMLLQFVPWGMKKLLVKQMELDNTVSFLKSSS